MKELLYSVVVGKHKLLIESFNRAISN